MSCASRALASLLFLFPAACISLAPRSRAAGEEAVVIEAVPASRWSDNTCGAGALSEVLNSLGDPVTEKTLSGSMIRAAHGGVVTVDLLLETRRRGFDAQLVRGDADLVIRELSLRHPLILMVRVLDARGTEDDLYHYVVLSGIDAQRGLVHLHYGDGRKRWAELRSLERGWAAGGYATFLIGRKTKTKATADDLTRAVLLEEEGKLREAIALLRFYLESHPEDSVAWTSLGNAQMKSDETRLAEVAYRNALFLAGDNVEALNNLAWLLLQERRLDEAETLARKAVALATHERAAALDTLERILAARKPESNGAAALPPPLHFVERERPSPSPFWLAAALLGAATIYDVESTFHFLEKCGEEECREGNPLMRPFIDRGRGATYAFATAVNAVVLFAARRLFDRGDPWWSLFPFTVTAVHVAAGTWNFVRARHED